MNEKNNIMHTGIWYGEIIDNTNIEELWNKVNKEENEIDKLLLVIELLKLGEFSAKPLLIKIMNESNDSVVINLSVRVFCSIAQHEDIHNIKNLSLLSGANDEVARLFASCSKYTLSYEVVPYLLAMLEEWEDTDVEIVIRDSLEWMLGYQQVIEESATIDEIGEFYINKNREIDVEKYYYEGQLAFPGILTKRLLDACVLSRTYGKCLKQSIIPKMLSIWSGIKCPVEYNTIVDDEIMRKVFDYVKQLSKMNWEKGCKYFYGHKI